jgi:hypothetical protein
VPRFQPARDFLGRGVAVFGGVGVDMGMIIGEESRFLEDRIQCNLFK